MKKTPEVDSYWVYPDGKRGMLDIALTSAQAFDFQVILRERGLCLVPVSSTSTYIIGVRDETYRQIIADGKKKNPR